MDEAGFFADEARFFGKKLAASYLDGAASHLFIDLKR